MLNENFVVFKEIAEPKYIGQIRKIEKRRTHRAMIGVSLLLRHKENLVLIRQHLLFVGIQLYFPFDVRSRIDVVV